MASIWKLGTVDIYVSGDSSEGDVKLAKHTVLDATGTSVYHYFGSGAEERSLQATIFTETNKDALIALRDAGTTVALTSDQGSEGNYKIQGISFRRMPAVKVDVAGVATDATVYTAEISLLKV